jgi:dTDP-4-amino-4,6-dideoxygalactose transaminase
VKHALAVSNCTTALHLALLAVGVRPGDEVLVPAFTWVSTANAVLYCGAVPVFVDIDITTFNIDLSKIADKITPKTTAIVPVHLFGLCSDIDYIKQHFPELKIVEDAACAAGSALRGRPAGSLGDIGCFSLHPRKSVTTGEGGILTTNNDEAAQRMDMLRNHGASISEEQRHKGLKPYMLPEFNEMGFNYRMTDLQGAIGVVQLNKLDRFIDERQKWAEYYKRELKDVAWLKMPEVPKDCKHGWQSFVTLIDETIAPMYRNDLMEHLQQNGISTRPGTHAVTMLGFYSKKYQINPNDYPGAQRANNFSMAIPLHNKMTMEDFEYVVSVLKSVKI